MPQPRRLWAHNSTSDPQEKHSVPDVDILARFNFRIFGGDKTWVVGVELTPADEPPARKPRSCARRPLGVDPGPPLRRALLLNLTEILAQIRRGFNALRYPAQLWLSSSALWFQKILEPLKKLNHTEGEQACDSTPGLWVTDRSP
ncbi:MAG: hypothetical protein ACLQIB_42865 [Isosphaeraceae bacterium]